MFCPAASPVDPRVKRQLGNFPQAFSHVFLINAAHNLSRAQDRLRERAKV
jgi:GH15 family glucan-1,4-alpha-glucosidase